MDFHWNCPPNVNRGGGAFGYKVTWLSIGSEVKTYLWNVVDKDSVTGKQNLFDD